MHEGNLIYGGTMIKVVSYEITCHSCPSQWEGKTEDGREVYIRFRFGCFYCEIDGEKIYQSSPKGYDGYSGTMSDADMKKELSGVLSFED